MGIELIVDMMDITSLNFLKPGNDIRDARAPLEDLDYDRTAIVSPSNMVLNHSTGLAKAIAEKAGGTFQADSYALIAPRKFLPIGESVVLDGGDSAHKKYKNLPGRYVIQTVCPTFHSQFPLAVGIELKKAYTSALMQAEALGIDTVVLPSLGTYAGYPDEIMTGCFPKEMAASYVKEVLEGFKFDKVKRVVLCFYSLRDNGAADLDTFKRQTHYEQRQMIEGKAK
jgi:O-acetyl-ADP-ribose deacetylase (regulator of RNase III)